MIQGSVQDNKDDIESLFAGSSDTSSCGFLDDPVQNYYEKSVI
eukprot:CAMPEP_0202967760 /NCGR_PEP_ID=MMETSP1396-20130829/12758_1 /ASSEMBLY_ACC=CAM_ASM_000872 /TAXON_ID= /ORGANISM="Pseudokeronopsis sp., Strain Brazil" /LENGTH=42 /DNA_ID= /DNA_START= /DNA_END= /DNA_ORIENTATION=